MAFGNGNPAKPFTKENAREMQRLGAIARSENCKKRKTFYKTLDYLLGLSPEELNGKTYEEAISVKMMREALHGNVKAFEAIRDSVGEKPTNKAEVDAKGGLTIRWARSFAETQSSNQEEQEASEEMKAHEATKNIQCVPDSEGNELPSGPVSFLTEDEEQQE